MITAVGMSVDGRSGAFSVLVPGFPSLSWKTRPEPEDVVVSLAAFRREDLDLYRFDARMDRLDRRGPYALFMVAASEVEAGVALQVLTRCQRLLARRNDESATEEFTRALRAHRAMHDAGKPLVRADLDHALDTWQWLLRLLPSASCAAQLAALFHTLRRRVTGGAGPGGRPARGEARARAGVRLADPLLREAGIPARVLHRAAELIASSERPAAPGFDPEARALANADALSFFSLKSSGYLEFFGEARTREKAADRMARLSPSERRRLQAVRMRPEVAWMVQELREVPYGAVERRLAHTA